jgi:hypothetical protein
MSLIYLRKPFNGREVRTLCFHSIVIETLNSFQIKNVVTMASAVARHQDRTLLLPQLEVAIRMREELERDFKEAGAI